MQQIVFVGALTVFYIGISVLKHLREKNPIHIQYQIIKFLLIEYIFCVLAVTILPIYIHLGESISWAGMTIQLIPFHFVKEYNRLIELDLFYLKIAIKNVLGNVVLFVPLGFLVPLIYKRFRNIKHILFIGDVCSVFIEVVQMAEMYLGFAFRMTDIDDVILNCCGCVIGYFFCNKFIIHSKMECIMQRI